MSRLTYVDSSKPFIATWDLSEFRHLLDNGIEMGSECFFLIKKIGICLYVRSTDFDARGGEDFQELAIHADGLDEDSIDFEAEDYEKHMKDLYSKSNPLYPGDLCEWFLLHSEMVDDCDLLLERGFDKIRMTVNSLSLDLSPFSEENQKGLRSGGVFTHNRSIRTGGGDCPISRLDAQIRFEYFNSKDTSIQPVQCWDEKDAPLHLNRESIQTYFG
tara:strand:+ start:663 stop:1310 length:648 start_codon:yes stop_codon:yes gene_type:complete